MSSEEQPNNKNERWWSYATKHDVINRAQIVAAEGADSPRVIDIDSFADFVNNEMGDNYIAITQMDDDADAAEDDQNYRGSFVYRPNDAGEYERHSSIITRGRFIGNKIMFIDDKTIVINTHADIGISASEYIVLESLCDQPTVTYAEMPNKVSNFTNGLLHRLLLLEKGTRRIYR
jgi:hypothetical protein